MQFLARLRTPTIIDDAHRVPALASALEIAPKPVILAGSRKMHSTLTTLRLYPPTQAELQRRPPIQLELFGNFAIAPAAARQSLPSYTSTTGLSERDVRDLVSIHDLDRFEAFYGLALARSGQILHQQEIARLAGISRTTAIRWLAVLDACFLTLSIPAYPSSLGRRTIKAPKLHFLDSPAFESRVVWEIYRNSANVGAEPELYYWRDSNGLQISLIIQLENGALPVPVAIAEKVSPVVETRLRSWMQLAGVRAGAVVTGLRSTESRRGGVCWYDWSQL